MGYVQFSITVDANDLAAFDSLNMTEGIGRSIAIRRLIAAHIGRAQPSKTLPPQNGHRQFRVSLKQDEYAALCVEAATMDMKATQWAAMAIRRWLRLDSRPSALDVERLLAIRRELKRIGNNVNQMAKAVNQLALQDSVVADRLSLRLSQLPHYMQDIKDCIALVRIDRQQEEWYWHNHHLPATLKVAPVQHDHARATNG